MPITFDDFKKVEIHIGRIVSAEKIPEGDKLLKLVVDFGTEQRQIMSGIAEFFPDPAVLVGRQAPFVINLETRVLRGHESQGMILATDGEKGIVLLHPASEVPNGSLVK
jgi:methionine--tRNA ligase beta chain